MKTRIEQLLVDNPLRKTATLHRLIVNESSEGRFGDPLDFPCPSSSQVAGVMKLMKAKLFGHVDTDEAVLKELKTRMVPGVIGEPSAKQAFAFGLAYVNDEPVVGDGSDLDPLRIDLGGTFHVLCVAVTSRRTADDVSWLLRGLQQVFHDRLAHNFSPTFIMGDADDA
ncbi:hypothetical protein H257_08801 [Aphanomyces astaci]|uniref:MULE transposase domain-containing protein n=1 Tax=Aphanomyces astaci TaxID=112090 RepID=W4GE67_APHAT|nr:hypothetical protein H257_08801 [Aphanomyces astaci]ETV77364.1 hypothetical protein H257_08801 [Aphanomyces astaci]|eukprot:XP_009833151.1 hypothetical protein H257_08801 [Aphanomyces astaci]